MPPPCLSVYSYHLQEQVQVQYQVQVHYQPVLPRRKRHLPNLPTFCRANSR